MRHLKKEQNTDSCKWAELQPCVCPVLLLTGTIFSLLRRLPLFRLSSALINCHIFVILETKGATSISSGHIPKGMYVCTFLAELKYFICGKFLRNEQKYHLLVP